MTEAGTDANAGAGRRWARAKGPVLLLVTAVLWGMAFVAQTAAADAVGPFTFNMSRNFVGAAFLCGVIAWRKRTGQDEPARDNRSAHGKAAGRAKGAACGAASGAGEGGRAPAELPGYSRRTLVVAGLVCGVLLCAASYLQQAGITAYPAEASASSRSGFVTATYMVMVAVMGAFLGKRPHPLVFAAVALALVGMYLLCVPDGLGNVYLGDWLVLASALGYALHIIAIDRYTQIDGVRLSRVQLLVAGTISLVCAFAFEQPSPAAVLSAGVSVLYAGICSDGIAYTLQIIAQKTTDPTVASIIMSLESVFAAVGGWLVLSESLSPVELGGCVLVFAAVLLSQLPELKKAEAGGL